MDGALAQHIFDLSAREVEGLGQFSSVFFGEIVHHRLPDPGLDVGRRVFEVYFIEEAALKSLVEVLREIGGGDQDAFECFHLL